MISARVLLLSVSICLPAIVFGETCEPCVTVKGDSSDVLVGEYRLIGDEPLCTEYPCSYTKVGGKQGDVYCFQSGDYTTALDECSSEPPTSAGATTPTTPETTLPPTSIDSSEKVTETKQKIGNKKSELETAAASASDETKTQIEEVTTELDNLTDELDGYQIDLNSDDRVKRQPRPRCERFGRILNRLNRMKTLLEKVVNLLSRILSSLARNNVIIDIITDIKDFLDGLLSDTRIEVMRIEKRKEKCEGQSGITTPEVEVET